MELEEQLKQIAANTGPKISFWKRAFGGRDYETLFENCFYFTNRFNDFGLVLVKYIIDEPFDFFSSGDSPSSSSRGTLAKCKRGQISMQALDSNNWIRYWTVVNYTDRDMNITSKEMNTMAETYAEDIAASCEVAAVFDSPKRGFKERTFYICLPRGDKSSSLRLDASDVLASGFKLDTAIKSAKEIDISRFRRLK